MTKHIAEELPTRKHAPAAAAGPAAKGGEGGKGDEKDPEKKVRQAVYDIRYRARREDVPLRTAYSQYMSNSNLGANERTAVKAKLFGDGPVKEAKELAADSVANAMVKVFVSEEEQAGKDKKMKVRVEDKSGKSYVRYADRAKITELRANPNIRSVEITSYGEPYEGERQKGERTAAAKAGKDYDGDGKVESSSKEHAGAVHNAIQRKKGGNPDGQDTRRDTNEEFIADAVAEAAEKKLDILPKDQTNTVKVHGKKGSGNANGVTESKEVMKSVVSRFRDKMKEREEQGKEAEKFAADTCDKCGKFPCECDDRARKTSMDLYKNKLRSMGLKMSFEPEGEMVHEDSAPIPNIPSPVTKPKDTKKPPTDGDKDRPLVPPGGFGDLSKPRDRTPRGGIDMGRGTPPGPNDNKYKKGTPSSGSASGGIPASVRRALDMSFEPEGDNVEEGLTDLQRRRYLGRRPGEEKERLKRANERKDKKAALAAMEKQYKGMKAGIYSSYEPEGDEIDEVTYPSDFKKGSGVAKKKSGRPKQHDQETDRYGRRKTVDEETEDSLKDKRMERGGVGGNQRYDRPPAKKLSNDELGIKPGKTAVQKELEKRHGKRKSAMDIVRGELEKKHGKGAVMSTKKKEEEKEEENEKEED